MSVFTTITKQKLNWEAPPPVEITGEAYDLLISDDWKIDIGDGFHLNIKPADIDIFWATSERSTGSNTWPSVISTEVNFLDIGSGFNLLISDDYKLEISTGEVSVTPWTPTTKNAPPNY